jgi:hypothetical protein
MRSMQELDAKKAELKALQAELAEEQKGLRETEEGGSPARGLQPAVPLGQEYAGPWAAGTIRARTLRAWQIQKRGDNHMYTRTAGALRLLRHWVLLACALRARLKACVPRTRRAPDLRAAGLGDEPHGGAAAEASRGAQSKGELCRLYTLSSYISYLEVMLHAFLECLQNAVRLLQCCCTQLCGQLISKARPPNHPAFCTS